MVFSYFVEPNSCVSLQERLCDVLKVAVNLCPLAICVFSPSNADLNPIRHLLALLGAHRIVHISGLRVNIMYSYRTTALHTES
jgi:ethanolamine ammonia-lyase large subunit